jgi:hypothetical protein
MHVDEPGTHNAAMSINCNPGPGPVQVANSRDPVPGYADISPAHRRAGAVDDLTTLNEEIHSLHLEREF